MKPKFSRAHSFEERFWGRIVKTDTCWNWRGHHDGHGYGFIRINSRQYRTHRISWLIHFGDIPKDMHVLHKCDRPCCVNPAHLWLGTHADNMMDKQRKGRAAMALTKDQVAKIRARAPFQSQRAIAEQFNVDSSLISRIVKGEVWPQ